MMILPLILFLKWIQTVTGCNWWKTDSLAKMSVSRAAHSSRKPHSCKKQFSPKACLSKLYDKHLVFSAQDCKHWSQSEVKIDPNVLPRKSLCSSVKEVNSVKLEGLDPSKIVEIKQKKREFFMSYTSHSGVCKCEMALTSESFLCWRNRRLFENKPFFFQNEKYVFVFAAYIFLR